MDISNDGASVLACCGRFARPLRLWLFMRAWPSMLSIALRSLKPVFADLGRKHVTHVVQAYR